MRKLKLSKNAIGCLAFIFAISITSVMAFADNYFEHPVGAYCVQIYEDQSITYSADKRDPYMKFEGINTSSNWGLNFQMQYSLDNSDIKATWRDDNNTGVYMSPGQRFKGGESNRRASSTWWRLCLDPAGPGGGVSGFGWTW